MNALRTRTPVMLASSHKALPTPLLQLLATRAASTTPASASPRSAPSTSTINPRPTPHLYARPPVEHRELPQLKSRTPLYLAIALAATLSWGGFIQYATNNERANSSVVRSLSFQLRASEEVAQFLGGRVRTPPLFGEFRIVRGSINMLAGKIDVQFRVQGDKHGGTAAFTSVRRGKQGPFEVLRWRITRDDGAVLDLRPEDELALPAPLV